MTPAGLRELLNAPGADITELVDEHFAEVFDRFEGARATSMEGHKLDRLENPCWADPVLSFEIERHGGLVKGSSRSEVQAWGFDFDSLTAAGGTVTYRQTRPRAPSLDTKTLAAELLDIMVVGTPDERVRYRKDGGMTIVMSKALPPSVRQTREGRSRRLRNDFAELCPPELRIEGRVFRREVN